MGNLILMYPTKINDDTIFSLWVHATKRVHFPTVFRHSTIYSIHPYNDVIKSKRYKAHHGAYVFPTTKDVSKCRDIGHLQELPIHYNENKPNLPFLVVTIMRVWIFDLV